MTKRELLWYAPMMIKDPKYVSMRMSLEHVRKLDDIAAHDGTTRSHLIRAAVARLLSGRKHTLYGDYPKNAAPQE